MKPLVNSDTIIFYGSIALLALYACHDISKPPVRRPLAPVRVNTPPISDIIQEKQLPKGSPYSFHVPSLTGSSLEVRIKETAFESELENINEELNDAATQRQQIAKASEKCIEFSKKK